MTVSQEHVARFLQPWRELWEYYARHPWEWTLDCVRTRNEDAAPGEPRERVPVPPLPHLEVMVWAYYGVKLLEEDKARQMMATWWLNWMHVHETQFMESANIGYQHMTSGDTSQKLEKYFLYVLTNQPYHLILPWVEERGHPPEEWVGIVAAEFSLSMAPPNPDNVRADQPPSFNSPAYHFARALSNRYRTKSGPEGVEEVILEPFFGPSPRYIEGIPAGNKGPNKWRGSTRTRASHDESWFHFDLANNVNSAKQSVGQNGRQTLISTASMGEDGDAYPLEMIERDPVQPEEFGGFGGWPTRKASEMPEGVEIWRTKMGYTHIRVHHFADPSKRGDEWIKNNVYTGDVRKNLREVLIQYNAPSGKPFYETFDYVRQRLQTRPQTSEGTQLVLCMDGGRRPAASAALIYPNGRVSFILELVTPPNGRSSNVTALATAFRGLLNRTRLTQDWQKDHILVCDPSMFDTRGETDDRTSSDILIELGFNPIKGAMDAATRYESLTNLNLRTIPADGLPALLVDPNACPVLYEALSGACTVSKIAEKTGQNIKSKDFFSHITDAAEYLATFVEGAGRGLAAPRKLLKAHRSRRAS